MRNQYKVLAEKYEAIQENSEESVMSTANIFGDKVWHSKKNGLLHRTDGPAYIYAGGDKEWWVNGLRHRLDGPAIEYANGDKEWWVNNKRHRTDGPARDLSKTHGIVEWYQNNKHHRLDGPAIIHTFKGGNYPPQKHYYINDVEYEKEEYFDRVNTLKGLEDLSRIRSKRPVQENTEQEPVMTVNKYGTKEWKLNGKLHRLDGPAVEWPGGRDWYQNGERHRLNGPAREWDSGNKEWYQNGKPHRLDGPAIEWSDGGKSWFQYGVRHRLDGPAAEYADGTKAWYINDKKYSEKEFKTQAKIYKGLKALTRIRSKQP